jgi:L-ascorbate metabolism protein UlaG (beta-lactamase superfamily)
VRYRNLEPPYEPHPLSTVLKWAVGDKLAGKRRSAPKHWEGMKVVEPDRPLIASATPSLTWVGHATWLVRLGGKTILTDPVWSDSLGPGINRNVRPGIELEALEPEVVVVSHNHRDHLDAPTIKRIGKRATYVVPAGLGAFFRDRGMDKVIELEWWAKAKIDELTIHFVPSQHWSQRGPLDKNETLWGGFVLEADARNVYFAGDTAWFEGFKEIGRRYPNIDAALLPIGAYDPEWFMRKQHMSPEDAVRAFESLGAKLFCAMHWGTFKLTDEPLDEPPQLLEKLRADKGIDAARIWVAAIGESRRL